MLKGDILNIECMNNCVYRPSGLDFKERKVRLKSIKFPIFTEHFFRP